MTIKLPTETLQKEAFKTLPAKEKGEYVINLLKKVLELNTEGITITQIKEATGLTYSTIWHHLEILCCTAQGHKTHRGNLDVYYPLGKASHLNDYDKDKIRYTISLVEDIKGNFVCIQEKRENRSGNQAVCSGVSIPVGLIDNIIETLNKAKKSLKK